MTFLNPFVLIGLIAASIPIIIHLLNLRKLKVVEFSSIKFLKEMQKNKMRKLKVKQILLLILRTLAIVFLVFSFSRPAIKSINLAGLGSDVKNTIVIFIDDTPSMSMVDKNGEYLSQAKKIGEKILGLVEEGDEIYLLRFSELSPLEGEYTPTRKSLALQEIQNIGLKDISRNFVDLFISLSRILEKSKNLSREVYVITDFQKSNLPGNRLTENLILDKVIDSNTRIYFFKIGEKNGYNISIDSITVLTKIFEMNKPVSLDAIVSNHSEDDGTNVIANLFFNDKKVTQKGIDIKKASLGKFSFTGQIKEYGFNICKLEIEDDELLKDNIRYFNFYVPQRIKVLMVSEKPEDLLFMNLVLSQTVGENSEPIFSITQVSPQFFNYYKPENFDLLIISSPEKIFNLKTLKDFIERGGKVLLLPSNNSTPIAFNRVLEQLGLNPIVGVMGSRDTKSNFTRLRNLDFNHPVFNGIFAEKNPVQIELPKVFYSFNYKTTLKGREIISLENNFSFLSEEKIGEGILFLFSSALVPEWTELPLKPLFVPLINRIALYLSSPIMLNSFVAGEEAIIKLNSYTNEIKCIDPLGKEFVISKDQRSKNLVNLGKLEIAGNYKIISGDKTLAVVSVNIDPKESELMKLEESKLIDFGQKSFPRGKVKIFSSEQDPVELIKQERYGTELWKLFLILVLICLALEMIIASSSKKDFIELQEK